jgi:proteasome accessory factor C
MDGFDRIYDLHKILSGRKTPIPLAEILSQMECSRATFNRVKRHMTDYLGAPIAYNRDLGGYYYQVKKSGGGKVFADARGGDARKRGGL